MVNFKDIFSERLNHSNGIIIERNIIFINDYINSRRINLGILLIN